MPTGYGTAEMCRRAFNSGAAEFFEKPVTDERLLEALHDAIRTHVRSRERPSRRAVCDDRARQGQGPPEVSPRPSTAGAPLAGLATAASIAVALACAAPLDHVNTLHWTAFIEAIVLGDGGPRHPMRHATDNVGSALT